MCGIVARESPDVIICGAEPITADVLRASKKLGMVMKHGVGVDNIDLDAAASLGIAVANTPGANNTSVADFTVAAMLALLRNLCEAHQETKAGLWRHYMGHELGRMRVGVIGTGNVGAEVVKRLYGFGATILAFDVVQNPGLISEYGVHYVTLEELLETSDIITLHVSLTNETRGMIGRQELQRMKKTALLINAARGELVDEDALYEHLKAGR
ncbi:MAG: hypothetical protein JRH07_03200 [Deltaproteobacteria bacterium]|nr:hypothetical protein [Deltaproteobacteria bacterium]